MVQNFWICINAVIPLMIYLLIGMLVKRAGLINDDEVSRFNHLVFIVLFPPMMFENLYGAKLGTAFNLGLTIFAIVFLFAFIAASVPIVHRIEKRPETRGAMIQAMYRSNFVLMGLPIALNICGRGNVSTTAVLVAVIVPIYNIIAVIILEYYRGGHADISKMFSKIIMNPIILGALAAAVAIVLDIRVPKSIDNVIYTMTECTTPMAMIMLGASFNIKSINTDRRNLSIVTITKLLIQPAIGLSLAVLFGFRGVEFVSLIVMMSAPCAVSSFTMAKSMGSDGDLAGNAVIFTTGFSILTIFGWLFLFKNMGIF